MRMTAVTCVKNEGPFLVEWIAFNRVIGITDFLFYSNDCSDGTDRLLDRLAELGLVMHLPNPARGRNYQMEALRHARQQPIAREADWVWIADVDEFLNIRAGTGTIAELIEACGQPKAVSFHFQFFSNCGVETFEDAPVIGQFTRSHNPDLWCDRFAIETKTLIHKDFPVHFYGAHRPYLRPTLPERKRPKWTDGSGRPVPEDFLLAPAKKPIRDFDARGARDLATLNHYALRSLDSYLVKNDRGDVNRDNRDFDDTYWRERNDDGFEDRSIRRYLPRLKAEIARLKSDPEVARLHDEAVALHRATRDRLLSDPAYVALRDRLRTLPRRPPSELDLIDLIA